MFYITLFRIADVLLEYYYFNLKKIYLFEGGKTGEENRFLPVALLPKWLQWPGPGLARPKAGTWNSIQLSRKVGSLVTSAFLPACQQGAGWIEQ